MWLPNNEASCFTESTSEIIIVPRKVTEVEEIERKQLEA